MAITDNDVEKLKGVFATKDELQSFRNEAALRFDGLKNVFATKEDLKAFATRDEILTRLDKILGEQEKTKEDKVLAKEKDDKQDQRLDWLEAKVGIA